MSDRSRRQIIIDTVDDLILDFLDYDRKDDDDLPRGEIEAAIEARELTVDEIVARFKKQLEEGL